MCKCALILELEPIGGAAGLVVLQVDRAAASRGCQVDPQILQLLLIRGEPVTQGVSVIGWYDGDLCGRGGGVKGRQ